MKPILFILISLQITIINSQNSGELLEKAYKKKSNEILYQFFLHWNQEVQPITDEEFVALNDTIKNTYQAFTAFYKPQSIDSLGGSEFGDSIYNHVNFLVIQNFIKIRFAEKLFWSEQEIDDFIVDYVRTNITDSSTQELLLKRNEGKLSNRVIKLYGPNSNPFFVGRDTLVDSINNFRPKINCNGKLPVYLTSTYESILINFLGNKYAPIGSIGIMAPSYAKGESAKRKKFLENQIKIWYGHWGGYWQLHSYPTAQTITFDKEMEYAVIYFRMIYEGGEALLKNENGNWVLISSQLTWIE